MWAWMVVRFCVSVLGWTGDLSRVNPVLFNVSWDWLQPPCDPAEGQVVMTVNKWKNRSTWLRLDRHDIWPPSPQQAAPKQWASRRVDDVVDEFGCFVLFSGCSHWFPFCYSYCIYVLIHVVFIPMLKQSLDKSTSCCRFYAPWTTFWWISSRKLL